MRKVLILFALLCSLTVAAQDVIIKKDGNTIVCQVVEVGQTEVVYQKWSDLGGANYVMNIADIASIQYKNGEKETFGKVGHESVGANMSQVASNAVPQYMSDAELLNMTFDQKKYKRIKRTSLIGGSLLIIAGTVGVFLSIENETTESWILSIGAMTAGATWATIGLIKAYQMKPQYANMVESTPLIQHEFKLNSKSSLSPQLCSIKDNLQHTSTIGIGLNYNF